MRPPKQAISALGPGGDEDRADAGIGSRGRAGPQARDVLRCHRDDEERHSQLHDKGVQRQGGAHEHGCGQCRRAPAGSGRREQHDRRPSTRPRSAPRRAARSARPAPTRARSARASSGMAATAFHGREATVRGGCRRAWRSPASAESTSTARPNCRQRPAATTSPAAPGTRRSPRDSRRPAPPVAIRRAAPWR